MPPYNPKLLIDQIRTDKVHGADWLSDAAISVIATAGTKEPAKTVDELHEILWGYAIELAGSRPSMAPLVNKLGVLFNRLDGIEDIHEYRAKTTEITGEIIDESINLKLSMIEHLKTVVHEVETVFTYSYSSTVKKAIIELDVENVIVTESRPGNEGITLAKELAEEGINVLTGVDGMVHMYMKAADMVIVGADSVQHNGSFINKVGTKMLGYAAKEFNKPFYVLCDTMKFNVLNYLGQDIELEEMAPEEVVKPSENLRVRNFYFEVIPPELVTAIITEDGIMEPLDIKMKMEEIRKQVEPLLNPKH
jgi:translation initiation factor eIF-2B subunit delta